MRVLLRAADYLQNVLSDDDCLPSFFLFRVGFLNGSNL